MAPAFTVDMSDDIDLPTTKITTPRTLLLAPPSVSSHPEILTQVAAAYDRNATDIQMLDRLAMGLVSLPEATYDVVLLLTDVGASQTPLNRQVMEKLVPSIKAGGRLRSQDGLFGSATSTEKTEAILAGLVDGGGDGMLKPDSTSGAQTVTLRFGKKKKADAAAVPANGVEAVNTAKRKSQDISTGIGALAMTNGNGHSNGAAKTPAGVVMVDPNDDFDDYDDDDDFDIPSNDELAKAGQIDPESLLTEEDRQRPIIIREYHPHLLHCHN